jgi:hypothetical protein
LTLLATLAGAALVLLALRDIFHELFHPGGGGDLSSLLMRTVWRVFRFAAARFPSALEVAGPAALLAVIGGWTLLLVAGWALVYLPHLPAGFAFSPGLDRSEQGGFLDALYLSLVTLTTLGLGDITPKGGWLRALVPLEALVGFGLLTASISWVLSLYPAISRRRTLAHEINLIADAEGAAGVGVVRAGEDSAARALGGLASRLVTVRGDLTQFPVSYYFHSGDERSALPPALPRLARLAEEGGAADRPDAVRLQAAVLRGALDDFAATLASRFLKLESATTEEVLAAYARDHRRAR